MPAKIVFDDPDNLIERYKAGASQKQLSDELGIGRPTLLRFLRKNGVEVRGRSAAEFCKWQTIKQTDPGRVVAQLSRAWQARTGAIDPIERKIRRAKTNYIRMNRVGKFEREVVATLRDRRIFADAQFPIGPYNVDLAVPTLRVAVEIMCTNHRKPWSSIRRERIEYILDERWNVLIVYVPLGSHLDVGAAANKVVAFCNRTRRDKAVRGHYGMVGRDGEPTSPARFDLPDRPRVRGF